MLTFLIEEKGCKVILREGNREQLLKMQDEFKLDIILTNSIPQINNSSVFETKLLCKEELVVVGHPKYKNLKTKWPESLKNTPIILPTYDSSTRQKIDFYFKEKNIFLDVVAEVEDKATEIGLALKGHGVMIAMRSTVKRLMNEKQLIEVGSLKKIEEEVWMLVGKRKILNPIALFAMKNFTLSHQ